MVFRRFSSLSRGDSDRLSASAMLKSCHKGMWVFATLLYQDTQPSGGLAQTLKQSAQEFKSMFWLTKGILFASQEIKSVGFHKFVGQDKRIWDWKDAAEECLTPEVQRFRNLHVVSYFRV